VFPGWLDLAGRVSSRTLTEYRYDATHYLAFCTDAGLAPLEADSLRAWRHYMIDATQLSPNTINRRLAAIKRLAKASAILKQLPADAAHEFTLVENAHVSWPYTNIAATGGKVTLWHDGAATMTNRVSSNDEAVNDIKSM
jgi:hypothetical protein